MSSWNQKLNEVDYFFQKCLEMDKFLGGSQKQQEEGKKKKGNELESLEEILREKIYELEKKQEERDNMLQKNGRSDVPVIKANVQIRDYIKTTNDLLQQFSTKIKLALKKNKAGQDLDKLQETYVQMKKKINRIQAIEDGDTEFVEEEDNRINLLDLNKESNELTIAGSQSRNRNDLQVDPSEIELEALGRYKQKDYVMDEKAEIIAQKAEEWKRQAQGLGQKQEHVNHLIKEVDKEVSKTNKILVSQNNKLKGILIKYRSPNKCCLDIVMLLVLITLIGIIIKMI